MAERAHQGFIGLLAQRMGQRRMLIECAPQIGEPPALDDRELLEDYAPGYQLIEHFTSAGVRDS